MLSDLYGAWINIKSSFSSDNDKATVQDCQRGLESPHDYNSVLQETDLAASTRELVLREKQSVGTAHASMARLALVV